MKDTITKYLEERNKEYKIHDDGEYHFADNMKTDGYNHALQDLINDLPTLLALIKEEVEKEIARSELVPNTSGYIGVDQAKNWFYEILSQLFTTHIRDKK